MFTFALFNKAAKCYNTVPGEEEDNKRPDDVVEAFKWYDRQYNELFGEIKVEGVSELDALANFYRLSLFSKNSLGMYGLNMCLMFQAIGPKTTIYVMKQLYNINVCIELDSIIIPLSKNGILKIVSYLSIMLNMTIISKKIKDGANTVKTETVPSDIVKKRLKKIPKTQRVALGAIVEIRR